MDLDALQANYRPANIQTIQPAKKKKTQGRGGFASSLISEGGATGGALVGGAAGTALLPGIGTVIGAGLGGLIGGFGGRLAENKVRDDRNFNDVSSLKEAGLEGAISGVMAPGPLKLLKGAGTVAKTAVKGTAKGAEKTVAGRTLSDPVAQTAQNVAETSNGGFLNNLTTKTGKRLTEAGSGLKADKQVGGIARLDDQAGFMSKYTGTPRAQRVKMETDMKDLSRQVDDTLKATPTQLDGAKVGERLRAAAADLTDERYLDLDLNNPSVTKIIDRYSDKFAQATDAKGINDIVKTLNKTATRAQNKLVDEKAGALTAQEQAALALKRAGDDVLSEIPEIAPLKKQMAQIFEVTPQVAKQAEKGISSPFLGGINIKAPVQALNAAQSKAGAVLQNGVPNVPSLPAGTSGIAGRVLAGRALNPGAPVEATGNVIDIPEEDIQNVGLDSQVEDTDPYSPANIQSSIKSIIEQGGTQKDVAEFLSNAKMFNDLAGAGGAAKPLSAEASKIVSNAETGLSAISDFENLINSDPAAFSRSNIPGKGFLDDLTGGRVSGALGTDSIDAAGDQIIDVIARLRTGAAISKQEEARFKRYIPRSGDSPEAINMKLGYLRDQFQMVANRSGSAGTDIEQSITEL